MLKTKISITRKIIFYFLPIILLSCKNEYHIVDRNSIFVANLDSICTSEFKYSDLYKKVTAISLDNKEVILTEISKLLVHKNRLYLLDRKLQGVYTFEKDGSFVNKFGNLGAGPDEYISCRDFAINTDASEIYIYDAIKNNIHKYDISSAAYKGSIQVDKSIHIDYITCNSGNLYAAQTSNRNEKQEEIYYLLYQIDIETGKKAAQWLDAASYNKGWNNELIHGGLFYNIRENENLFVLGLMDTIISIKENTIFPFLAIESERLVQKSDILEEEKTLNPSPRIRSRQMMSLLTRLSAQNKFSQISNIFEHKSMLYFNCMGGRIYYFIQFDEKEQTAFTYSRVTDDILFQTNPDHFQVPVFLSSDENGVYYYVSSEKLSELKYFINENSISKKVVNRKSIKESNDDSNPIILYYEYKD